MFDSKYFRAYAKDSDDWIRGYRARLYYYKALRNALFRLKPGLTHMAEIGCGLGMFSHAVLSARHTMVLYASDISEYAVTIARERLAPFSQAHVRLENAEEISLPSESCEVVVSLDVVEHLLHPETMIGQVFRILKPSGIFLFTTPNACSLGARLKMRTSIGDPKAVLDSPWTWFAHRDPTHVNVHTPDEWRSLCSSIGFVPIRDGSDGCWDTPYLRGVPLFLQKLLFNGSHRLLMRLSPVISWSHGENYIGFWQKR